MYPPPLRLLMVGIFISAIISGCSDLEDTSKTGEHLEQTSQMSQLDEPSILQTGFSIGPPHIRGPVYECAERITVESLLPDADVRVFNQHDVEIGSGTAQASGRSYISLNAPVEAFDVLYAVQIFDAQRGPNSDFQVVEEYPLEDLPKPTLRYDAWECGQRVAIDGVIPGPELVVERDSAGNEIGDAYPSHSSSRNGWWPVSHAALPYPSQVRAYQTHCGDTGHGELTIEGPESDWYDVNEAPSPMPDIVPDDVTEGTTTIRVRDALVGASLSFAQQSSPQVSGKRLATAESVVMYSVNSEPIQDDPDVEFATELCEMSDGISITPDPIDDLKDLDPPEVIDPICPQTSAVEVKASHASAVISLFHNNDPTHSVVATDSHIAFSLHGLDLQDGDELKFAQHFPGTDPPPETEPAIVTVSDANELVVDGARKYIDQDSNHTIEGFVRETSRGPKFNLRCCAECQLPDRELGSQCYSYPEEDEPQPRTATVDITEDNTTIDQVTLYEEYPGHFVGRWDWFMEDGSPDPWPPAPSRDYEAIVSSAPCGENLSQPIDVLIGEIDENDDTPPELVELTVTDGENNSETVDQDSASEQMEILPDTSVDISAVGFDPEGLSEIAVVDNQGLLNAPTEKSSDPNTVPIPAQLSLDTTIDGLDPYETTSITAQGSNFNSTTGPTESADIDISGAHPTPVIDSISPEPYYSDMILEISGEELRYETLDTVVHFELDRPGESTINATYEVSDSSGSPTLIEISDFPSALQEKHGSVDVSVVTENAGGIEEESSNTVSFELRDREQGSFQEFGVNDFSQSTSDLDHCDAEGADPGAIIDISFSTQSGNHDFAAIIESENNIENVPFSVTNNSEGGVVLGENCRMAAVLSRQQNQEDPARFSIEFLYFSPSDEVEREHYQPVDLFLPDENYVPRAFGAFFSPDETIVGVGTLHHPGTGDIPVRGWMYDFLNLDEIDNDNGSCETNHICEPDITIDGSIVRMVYERTSSDELVLIDDEQLQ